MTRHERMLRNRRKTRVRVVTVVVAAILGSASVAGAGVAIRRATAQNTQMWTCMAEAGHRAGEGHAFGGFTAYERTCGPRAHAFGVEGHGHIPSPPTTQPPTTQPPSTTKPPVTTTTAPTTTTTGGGSIGDVRPPPGGYFKLQPPGSALPTDAACAAAVHRSTWEPRPDNAKANSTVPPSGYLTGQNGDWNATWNSTFRTRITGNFTGTTDQIIQWAACKWGWADDLVRGEGIDESNWHMSSLGDTSSSQSNCWPGYTAPCPTSFGFLQIKWYYNPSRTIAGNAMPWARDSTAFSIDYALAELRGCYEGMSTFLPKSGTLGNLAGCVGSWFNPSPYDPSGGAYWSRVNGYTQGQSWRNWSG